MRRLDGGVQRGLAHAKVRFDEGQQGRIGVYLDIVVADGGLNPRTDLTDRQKRQFPNGAVVGVSDHCGWAVLVTVAADGTLIDRRRVDLVTDDLPSLPHHHECQMLPIDDAVELVERVSASANEYAEACLDALAAAVSPEIVGVAMRRRPALPEGIAERIANYRAQTMADTVMYRDALAAAATARHWFVSWYEPKAVFAEADQALGEESIDRLLKEVGGALGPPWRKEHRMAMAAAIAAHR